MQLLQRVTASFSFTHVLISWSVFLFLSFSLDQFSIFDFVVCISFSFVQSRLVFVFLLCLFLGEVYEFFSVHVIIRKEFVVFVQSVAFVLVL